MDISAWLKALGLNQYEKAFAENAIDGEVLFEPSEADLEKLGIHLLGHRSCNEALAAVEASAKLGIAEVK